MKYFLIIISLFGSFLQAQCDDLLESQCTSSSDCEWVITDTENYNCANFGNQSSCENYSGYGCSWEFSWGGWQNYGSSCVGGSFSVISGICEEIEVLECSEMNQLQCTQNDECNWIENIDYESCSNLPDAGSCTQASCNWYCDSTYTWLCYCTGGSYEIDNSYCEEVSFLPGDANGDGSLNVSDIVLMVDLILSLEYDNYSDMNQDGVLNILDVVEIVNIILDN